MTVPSKIIAAPNQLVTVDCPLCDQSSRFACEECDGCGKIMVTPAAPACKTISTWRERIGQAANFPLHVPTDVERAMVAEIAELRAALTGGAA